MTTWTSASAATISPGLAVKRKRFEVFKGVQERSIILAPRDMSD